MRCEGARFSGLEGEAFIPAPLSLGRFKLMSETGHAST